MNQSVDNAAYQLSETQQRYFATFGFLLLEQLFADDIQGIAAAFDSVMFDENNDGVNLDYSEGDRLMVPAILDRHEDLKWLKTDPRILGIAQSIIGRDWVYAESSGDLLECETTWHRDVYASPLTQLHIKLLFYLDPLDAETGALRVMPGTNYYQDSYTHDLLRGQGFPDRMKDVFGVDAHKLPGVPVPTRPGDVIVLNFRTVHASFAGKGPRRLLNLNFKEPGSPTG